MHKVGKLILPKNFNNIRYIVCISFQYRIHFIIYMQKQRVRSESLNFQMFLIMKTR